MRHLLSICLIAALTDPGRRSSISPDTIPAGLRTSHKLRPRRVITEADSQMQRAQRARRLDNNRRKFETGHWQYPDRAEEGREYHEDGTVVINYRNGSSEEYPPSCRNLVPA